MYDIVHSNAPVANRKDSVRVNAGFIAGSVQLCVFRLCATHRARPGDRI